MFTFIFRDKKAIPPGIAPSTQVLDLRGNDIRVLHNNVFLQLGITNLQRIYCSYCDIVEIEPRAFRRLTNLVELDLSENAMREVPSEAWKHTKALMRLNLSGNPIKLIRYFHEKKKLNGLQLGMPLPSGAYRAFFPFADKVVMDCCVGT